MRERDRNACAMIILQLRIRYNYCIKNLALKRTEELFLSCVVEMNRTTANKSMRTHTMATARKVLTEGTKAPAFTLFNQDGKKTKLTDHKGEWVVLYFYPKDDTPGCTVEACEFTVSQKSFEQLNAVVLGVSPDSPERHVKFIDKYDLKITLLSDPDHKMIETYGAWGLKKNYGREYDGVIRSTVLINPQGKIAAYWPNVKAKGHALKVKERLEELTN